MVNCGGSENDSACCRMILCAMAWKVPPQIRSDEPSNHAAARASMSLAARRVKVSSRIRLAGTPWLPCSHAALATSVLVFPVPAPASTRSGPPCCVAARRCCSFSPSSTAPSSNMHMNITRRTAADPYAAPAAFEPSRAGHRTLVTDSDDDPGPQPSRADKRWYFGLMATCIGLFVLSWAVIDRYSLL